MVQVMIIVMLKIMIIIIKIKIKIMISGVNERSDLIKALQFTLIEGTRENNKESIYMHS